MRSPGSASAGAAFAIAAALVLAACGGGDDSDSGGQPPNMTPVASAGAPQTVVAGATVSLNGAASSDPDGAIAAYAWTQTSGPAVTLVNASSAQPSFQAPSSPADITLTFSLVVTDNRGATSAASTVSITVSPNMQPVAYPVASALVYGGNIVTLDGTQSIDPDGSISAYSWTQTSGPVVTLSGGNTAQPTFVAPVGTVQVSLTFALVVTDNRGATSTTATVAVQVNANLAPVAVAVASSATAAVGNHVTLSGTSSIDTDGSISTYSWSQASGPATYVYNDTSPQAFIIVPMEAVASMLTFRLVVTDNRGVSSEPSFVTVAVNANTAPVADAGPAQAVNSGTTTILDASASSDLEGGQLQYSWTQTQGPTVVLNLAVPARPSFVAPSVTEATALTFRLVVTDSFGVASAPAMVTITVNPAGTGMTTVGGTVRFERVPFGPATGDGLDYSSQALYPARGVMVNAYSGTSGTSGTQLLATGFTDANGAYSFSLPVDTTIRVQVVARMQRDHTQPAPRWDVRVQNGEGGATVYSFMSPAFSSSAGTQDVTIPSGIAANGAAIGVRASGPFAILDTVYTAFQSVLATGTQAEALNPTLAIDWGSHRDGTYFTTDTPGFLPLIKLQSDLAANTDEFDQHVVARELGRYIQYAYSRSDDLGGDHDPQDKLDMRVAFSSGFATAFAAIVLDDPQFRDSHVSGGSQLASVADVEANPDSGAACWCSAASVASILWDLYDDNTEASDGIALGFKPIWDELAVSLKITDSLPTIFSFVTALKASQPALESQIDSVVAAQNINSSGIDAFASNETNAPFPNMLPLFANIVVDGPAVQVRSIDDGGRHNKAGNHGLLRFTAPFTGSVSVTVATSNPNPDANPDFVVYRGSPDGVSFGGGPVLLGTDPAPQPEVKVLPVTVGKTYVIDAYDCANGCRNAVGTPGDYSLTVSLATVP